MADDDKVYQLRLPEGRDIVEWFLEYGKKVDADELNRLIHYKNQELPKNQFIVWCSPPLMGKHKGWILKDITSVRVLWHSLGKGKGGSDWYYIPRTLAMPFTDAPVF
jgi:hypothetical protein